MKEVVFEQQHAMGRLKGPEKTFHAQGLAEENVQDISDTH